MALDDQHDITCAEKKLDQLLLKNINEAITAKTEYVIITLINVVRW